MPVPIVVRRPSPTRRPLVARAGLLAAVAGLALLGPRLAPEAGAASSGLLPGRPPTGPLSRDLGRIHDVNFQVRLNSRPPYRSDVLEDGEVGTPPDFINRPGNDDFNIAGGIWVMPVATISTWHRTELERLSADVLLEDRRIVDAGMNGRLTRTLPFDVQRAEIPIPAFEGQIIGLEFRQRTTTWASVIDDAAAAQLPWPEWYPEDVQDGLAPSLGIPSEDPFFAGIVRELFGADVTSVAPYIAAKRIAGHVASNFQLTRPRIYRGLAGTIDGYVVNDLITASREGQGSPVDMICLTVAIMRAAGIPARPVFGVTAADDKADEVRGRETLTMWAEFYLDGAGWVPFDPERLRGNGSWRNTPPDRPWPNFGTWKDLNQRIPMAYEFVPGPDARPFQRPSIHGVRLEGGSEQIPAQYITIGIVSRGRS
jgi:transglutaminase-like putative cysteine protease